MNLMKKSGKVVWVGENENEDAGKCDEYSESLTS